MDRSRRLSLERRAMPCDTCDVAATRCARLVLALRKAALWIHTDRAHAAVYFEQCADEPCVSITDRLREVGAPLTSLPRPYVRKAVTEPEVLRDDAWERRQLDRARATHGTRP
jgi:hypothetical protein